MSAIPCYGVDALAPIDSGRRGCLAQSTAQLAPGGNRRSPIIPREGLPAAAGPAGGATH